MTVNEQIENVVAEDENSVSTSEVTATEDRMSEEQPVSDAEESDNDQQDQGDETKRFTQAELDALISKRLAREQRKWDREQQAKRTEIEAREIASRRLPPAEQFDSPEAYAEALAEQKALEIIARRDAERYQAEIQATYHEKEEEAISKYDDFQQVAYNPTLPVTDVMADTIRTSDIGPDIAYYLGSNRKEAERISRLPLYAQAKEIGKIEAKLTDSPPTKKTSKAPPPIAPVASRSGNNPAYDTTDPRSTKTMSTSEWIEAERVRQRKKLEAQRR